MNIFIFLTSLLTTVKSYTFPWNSVVSDKQSIVREVSAFSELKDPLFADPKTVEINFPNGNKKTLNIEKVGLNSQDQLETPKDWMNAGWYYKSARPGEVGTTIIDGHYDNSSGGPAAFWPLKNIRVNDKVILKDKLNRNFTYEVVDSFYVDINDPDRLQVFKDTDNPTLTLITCSGVWDYTNGTYNKRLVVNTKLVESDLD